MGEILIFHSRQAGDVIIGSHCARLVKKKYPKHTLIFVTQKTLVPLIEPCPWIDLCLPTPNYNISEILNDEESNREMEEWQVYDLIDLRTFEKMRDAWVPEFAFRPHWNPSDHPIPYRAPYMFRCYAHCCGLTQEEANDTAYELPISETERTKTERQWEEYQGNHRPRVLLHMHYLDPSFARLTRSHNARILDVSGETSWRDSLVTIAGADFVVTRYGGVAVMAAAVGVKTIQIPKPEPTMWASPVCSHPNQSHVILLPEQRCHGYEGTSDHRYQPCQPKYAEYVEERCVLGRKAREGMDESDSFHCWRDVSVEDVQRFLNEYEDSVNADRS